MSEHWFDPPDGEPGSVAFDQGWTDAWAGMRAQSLTAEPEHVRRAYAQGYALGLERRPAFDPDCDTVHEPGACPLVVPPRDPWWVRALSWLSGRWWR